MIIGQAPWFDTYESAETMLISSISTARRSIHLFASLNDPALFNSRACIASCSRFARSSSVARMKILIEDHKLFTARNPALLALAQRLTGRIQIRTVSSDKPFASDCYLVGDHRSVWYMPDTGNLSGFYEEDNRVRAQKLTNQFLYTWERSRSPVDFRHLAF